MPKVCLAKCEATDNITPRHAESKILTHFPGTLSILPLLTSSACFLTFPPFFAIFAEIIVFLPVKFYRRE